MRDRNYRTTSWRRAGRVLTRRTHLDLTPTVTDEGYAAHHAERARTLAAQRYQTGARYGQELADARRRARP